MESIMRNSLLILLLVLAGNIYGLALDPIFTDNMVLQRDMALRIYGKANPGQSVEVVLNDKKATTTADADGNFIINLPTFPAGGPYQLEITAAEQNITLQNVMIGEVWLCSGQSNMHWAVSKTRNAAAIIADANNPNIRLCKIPYRSSAVPVAFSKLQWQQCNPDSVKDFSAVAYHFADKLQRKLGVAVGVIQSSYGATPAESWISKDYLYATPRWKHLTDAFDEDCRNYEMNQKNYKETIFAWKRQETEAKKKGEKPPPRPATREPRGPETYDALGGNWNAMIYPLGNLVFRGVLWYQGESNHKHGWEYRELFADLIQEWRRHFHNEKLPFIFVQISTQMRPFAEANKLSSHAELRESQEIVSKTVPFTGMVTAIDLGDDDHDTHPKNKEPLAQRLCDMALYQVYGLKEYRLRSLYPALAKYEVQGNKVIIELSNCQELHTNDGREPANFQIAGKDRRYHWAQAEISGNKLIVSSPGVNEPVAVRYAWSHSFQVRPNLYNEADLPVLPFRTEPYPNLSKPRN